MSTNDTRSPKEQSSQGTPSAPNVPNTLGAAVTPHVSGISAPTTLADLRQSIDSIDTQLVQLLHKRAEVSLAVGTIKKRDNLPIWQPQREQELLQKICNLNGGTLPSKHLTAIYREILASSKALQHTDTIGYLGPEGTYSHLACTSVFGQFARTKPYASFRAMVAALAHEECDYAIIPIENSLYGTVSESFDLLREQTSLRIIAEHVQRIQLAALSLETNFDTVTTVFSHAQPLGQCAQWLATHLPNATLTPVESTAVAAEKAVITPQSIAIGHEKMASLKGLPLHVLAAKIEDSPHNWTRFFVIQRADSISASPSKANKSTLIFSVPDNPGSLAHVLGIFANAGANLSKLESRPTRTGTWKYVFFADLNCDVSTSAYTVMLSDLSAYCHDVRVLGTYTASTGA